MKKFKGIFVAGKLSLAIFLCVFMAFSGKAQFFSSHAKSSKRNPDIPTVVKAETMDLDISKNVAVFTGNVQVDDADMQIFCHKLIINFEGEGEFDEENTNRSVKDIICLKNVVIIRKLGEVDSKEGEQKALAGKAVYDVKSGKITLTEDPELRRGEDLIKGRVIQFWIDSERLNVEGSTELRIRSNPSTK
ncbi:MAG: hypothetical protein JW808_06810 [Victivallales bacterium]|nr:hypothetical protein [Victivallales bacterium]